MGFWKKASKEMRDAYTKRRFPAWMAGVAIGVFLLALGAYYDQFTDIFRKAVMICLECIGIG